MTQLTVDPAPDSAPRWSPDGREMAFRSQRSGNREIWILPIAGGAPRQLTDDPAEDSVPAWSPDGDEIAFISRRGGSRDVWIVSAEGGEPRQFTAHAASEYFPLWSRDGSWLLFQSSRMNPLRFFRKQLEGGEVLPIGTGPGQEPRWSSDGDTLYFPGWAERAGNLWALSVEDGNEYPVTDLVGRTGTVGYSMASDGAHLYFTWWEDLGDIWVMDVVTDESE